MSLRLQSLTLAIASISFASAAQAAGLEILPFTWILIKCELESLLKVANRYEKLRQDSEAFQWTYKE